MRKTTRMILGLISKSLIVGLFATLFPVTSIHASNYLYNSDGKLDYEHLDSGQAVKFEYDSNGNLLSKKLTNLQPESSLDFSGERLITLSDLAVNKTSGGENTVEFWMYWDGTDGVMPFVWNPGYDLYLAGGYFGFNTFNSDLLGIPSASLINKWVHVAAVFYNGIPNETNCELYINGKRQILQQAIGSIVRGVSAGGTVNIGGYEYNGIDYYMFRGKIADLRIWNDKLSASQIQTRMYQKLTGDETGLVGQWMLSDMPSQSMTFDGNQLVTLSDLSVNTTSNGKNTVEFWMYWDGTEDVMPFVWNPGYDLYFAGGYFGFNTFNSDLLGIPSASLINKWVHVAAVFDNGIPNATNCELYINGKRQILQQAIGTIARGVSAGGTVNIGGYEYNGIDYYMFRGKIADLRIWNDKLSASQIKSNIYQVLKGNENNLVGEWKFHKSNYVMQEY